MKRILSIILLVVLAKIGFGQTFKNPVVWADCPDPDVIRVGEDFYMVTTTMHLMPHSPIMKSKDLVNWQVIGYLDNAIKDNSKYDFDGGTVYGRGQWATSLRYKDNMFWAYFSPNDEPWKGFIYKSSDAATWELHARTKHYHDASLFFDDNGKNYIFFGSGNMAELSSDLKEQVGEVKQVIFRDKEETGLLEGSRVIKKDGYYYVMMISWPIGGKRRQLCYRSKDINGPYEKQVVLEDNYKNFPFVAQGTILDTKDGKWYGMIFQDRGGIGRVLTLNEVKWQEDWPMMNKVEETLEMPVKLDNQPTIYVTVSDDFSGKEIKKEWQFNHNYNKDKAYIKGGKLCLETFEKADNLFLAKNTITQRFYGPKSSGEVLIDLKKMKNGDRCGLSAFNSKSYCLEIQMRENKKYLCLVSYDSKMDDKTKSVECTTEIINEKEIASNQIYLKVSGDFSTPNKDEITFCYSLNGKDYTKYSQKFQTIFDYRRFFMGVKFAIYNYSTKEIGGVIKVDYFDFEVEEK